MSPTEVFVAGLAFVFNSAGVEVTVLNSAGQQVPRPSYFSGSAVEIAPGQYLSSAHIFYGPITDGQANIYTSKGGNFFVQPESDYNTSNPLNRNVSGSNPISTYNNISGYAPSPISTVPVHDVIAFSATTADSNPTGVVLFSNPSISVISAYFASLNYTGYIATTDPGTGKVTTASQPHQAAMIATVNADHTFSMNQSAPPGFSGAGVWGTVSNGTNYVIGTIIGQNATQTQSLANYLSSSEFYKLFPETSTSISTKARNLVVGSKTGNDKLRGAYQTTDIIDLGNNNIILAAGNGETINAGPGTNNVLFASGANGIKGTGTTFV